jgi:hypothetical protein
MSKSMPIESLGEGADFWSDIDALMASLDADEENVRSFKVLADDLPPGILRRGSVCLPIYEDLAVEGVGLLGPGACGNGLPTLDGATDDFQMPIGASKPRASAVTFAESVGLASVRYV